jgi:hypothetical protein
VKLSSKRRALAFFHRYWPWILAFLFAFVLACPLLLAGDRVFVSDLQGDGVITPWIYDFTSRELINGRWPSALSDFDFPFPRGLSETERSLFATVPPLDAVLMAPVAWLLSWPAQWNATIFVAMLVNAAGAVMLARAMDCRKLGLVVASVLGVACGPIWIEAFEGRANCMFPGLTLMAIAALLESLPQGLQTPFKKRFGLSVLAAVLGWLSFVIYPPGLVLWVPMVLLLGIRHTVKRRWVGIKELRLPAFLILVAYVLALPSLWEISDSGWVMQEFTHLECPPVGRVLALDELAKFNVGEPFRGFSFGFWILAPFALMEKERRKLMAALLVLALFMALLSLGPCPTGSRSFGGASLGALWSWPIVGDTSWWVLSYLHYYDRLAVVACLLLAVLSAVGAESLWERNHARARSTTVLFVAIVLFQVVTVHWRTVMDPERWQEVGELETASFLAEAPEGAVVELPFDQRDQFLSVLQSSSHKRLNPLRPQGKRYRGRMAQPRKHELVWTWFDGLGHGEQLEQAPRRLEINKAGIRWIFYDPQRCLGNGAWVPTEGCSTIIQSQLEAVLGRGRRLGKEGVLLWEVAGSFE